MYHFKEMLDAVKIEEGCIIGTLDIIGMFPNVTVQKTLEVVREKLETDDSLKLRTKWEVKDIMKLLEISVETYFKTIDGKIYFQRDGLPIGKSISKPLAGIYICIGSRKHTFLRRMESSATILFFGRDRWMTYFLCGKEAKKNWSYLYGN